ncbi:hypothetical protein BCV72DRAFT_303180 [Rhizopus microsporus var. microsporus]|uniref:Uncharacterized protein n=2 Tax=Rhizopus microsporus TaxID=58291 RepID=A0A2G4T5W7_RHIZD|nr:uncharacterized protein RHIMIDRAFT_234005 [Rhizopus microsporus ATCC 52813]ORE08958.1 hypothetical protein BCV72DRAFT_303180 [Rhizopus microsporus var. microsporus]PHZ16410.1 hypothetical protein RHIMIDRAFT_234005 [Rhizopus microsporus ATCC 52813]
MSENKWDLKSGRSMEDVVYNTSKSSMYEHPSCSYIIDLYDGIWRKRMVTEDLDKISSSLDNLLNKPLHNLKEILYKLDKESVSREIYDKFNKIPALPANSPEDFWLKQAVLDYFFFFAEQDPLEDAYGLINKSKRSSGTTVTTYDQCRSKQSYTSPEHKSKLGIISNIRQEEREDSRDQPDLCFHYVFHELACLEIDAAEGGSRGIKEMNEMGIKAPLMMTNFALLLTYSIYYPSNTRSISVSSKLLDFSSVVKNSSISALLMTFDRGSNSVIIRSRRLRLPETANDIPCLLSRALQLMYNSAQVINGTIETIKKASASVFLDAELECFPPCFLIDSNNRKRKAEDE